LTSPSKDDLGKCFPSFPRIFACNRNEIGYVTAAMTDLVARWNGAIGAGKKFSEDSPWS
jgi:hypothetical protein